MSNSASRRPNAAEVPSSQGKHTNQFDKGERLLTKALRQNEALQSRIEELERGMAELQSNAPESLWKIEHVAQRLNVSQRTVEKIINEGKIRPLWVRGSRRFTPAAVDAYLRKTGGNYGAA